MRCKQNQKLAQLVYKVHLKYKDFNNAILILCSVFHIQSENKEW